MISVIVPVYRVEKYLERCVNSILSQTLIDLEVILVDDGSPDGCGALCDAYALKDNRIKVIHKKNGGLSDARNAGLEAATGEYIMFVDGDDYIHPRMAEHLSQAVEQTQADVAFCGIDFFEDQVHIEETTGEFRVYDVWKEMAENPEFSVCNRLFRRQRFENIRFPVGRLFEDQFVIFKLLRNAKVVCTDDKMYYYFQRYDGLSKSKVYHETYDLLDASLEMLGDIPEEEKTCSRSFGRMAVKRIGLMLGNAYYHDGQYQNCQISTIVQIVRDHWSLLSKATVLFDKWMLRRVVRGSGILFRLLVKSYLDPWKMMKAYFRRIMRKT